MDRSSSALNSLPPCHPLRPWIKAVCYVNETIGLQNTHKHMRFRVKSWLTDRQKQIKRLGGHTTGDLLGLAGYEHRINPDEPQLPSRNLQIVYMVRQKLSGISSNQCAPSTSQSTRILGSISGCLPMSSTGRLSCCNTRGQEQQDQINQKKNQNIK